MVKVYIFTFILGVAAFLAIMEYLAPANGGLF